MVKWPFKRLSDPQLRNQKVTLNDLAGASPWRSHAPINRKHSGVLDSFLKPGIITIYEPKETQFTFFSEENPLKRSRPGDSICDLFIPYLEVTNSLWLWVTIFQILPQFPKQNDVGNNWSWPHGCKLNVAPRTWGIFVGMMWDEGLRWNLGKFLKLLHLN